MRFILLLVSCLFTSGVFSEENPVPEETLVSEENRDQPPVDLIVYADYLLTMEEGAAVIEKGAVAIRDGVIVAVGKADAVDAAYDPFKTISGEGRALMPGLVNGHTHSAMTLFRGLADDLPLMEWLQNYIFPMEGRFVDREFVQIGMRLACLEMIKGGTTTFADMYFYPKTAVETVKDCGMRAIIGAPMIDFPSPGFKGWDDSLQAGIKFVRDMKADGHRRITPAFAPHAPYTVSPDHLEEVLAAAKAENVPILMHLAESRSEVDDIQKRYGTTPVTHVEALGMLSHPMAAAHMVFPTPEEIIKLAKSPVGAFHNPTSNLKTGSGISPVPEMLAAGVKVGLGTDGAASNNDLNMWDEIRLAALIHKGVSEDPTKMPAATVLAMATRIGAEGLQMGDKIGVLKPGMRADMIQIDLGGPHLTPLYNVPSHLVYATHPSDVVTTIIEGTVLMADGKMTLMDEDAVIAAARVKAGEIAAVLAAR